MIPHQLRPNEPKKQKVFRTAVLNTHHACEKAKGNSGAVKIKWNFSKTFHNSDSTQTSLLQGAGILDLECLGSNPCSSTSSFLTSPASISCSTKAQLGWTSVPVFPPSLTIQVQVILQRSDEGPFSLQTLTGWPQPITTQIGFITALQQKEPESLITTLICNHVSLCLT